MTNVTRPQHTLLVDQENAAIPYSAETLAFNKVITRSPQPFSALKERKFRTMFNRHTRISGCR